MRQKYMEWKEIHDQFTVVNCWHLNEFESVAMWKLYSNYNDGIAIQSSFKSLSNSFIHTRFSPGLKNQSIYYTLSIGMVNYIDFQTEPLPYWEETGIYLYKDKSFEHERELRAIAVLPWDENGKLIKAASKTTTNDFNNMNGVYFPVDLSALIHNVWIAPNAPLWFKESVKSVLEKYHVNVDVIQSDLLNVAYLNSRG